MCGYTVKIKRKRVGYVCGGKNKNKKEKTKIKKQNEDIERRRVGTCVKEKKPRKPKKKKLLGWAKFITNHRDFDKF